MRNQLLLNYHPQKEEFASILVSTAAEVSKVTELTETERDEVLRFLSDRPVHTVVMTSFIIDNGIKSHLNRGTFYGYRNLQGVLEGVALIGHSTLIEARSDAALAGFAEKARSAETPIHMIMSHGTSAKSFWDMYTGGLNEPRLVCEEQMFELGFPMVVRRSTARIRLAHAGDLMPVAEAQAEVAFMECGVDPLIKDRDGFLKRVLRRIEQGRVFVVFDGDKLIFKADVIAETTETAYLEGIYVAPDVRGKGVGSDCLHHVAVGLLGRVGNVCLLSNVEFERAHNSYRRAGFKETDTCTTIFV